MHRTLCNPVDCGLLGFSVREGVLLARILLGIFSPGLGSDEPE